MCEDNIEYDNDLKNEDYLKYEGGQPKIYIQSHIFNYCQAQFQLASSVWFSRTEICLISDNYHPPPE